MKTTKYYVQCEQYSSTDWHDMATVLTQMKQNGCYEINNPEEFIARDILEHVKDLKSSLTIEDIVKAMNAPDDGYFIINDVSRIEIFSKNHGGIGYQLHYDEFDYTFIRQYYIRAIDTDNVAYLVSEHIVNPGKGYDLLQRVYHEMFDNLLDAEKYQEEMMKNYKHEGHTHRKESGYKISVEDKNVLKQDEWYKENMFALKLLNELNENVENYRFYSSAKGVVFDLQQKKYERATREEQLSIDWVVYQRVREYLTNAQAEILDETMNAAKIDPNVSSREAADKAILFAFINADSQIAYELIYAKLGEYECRISQLTEANAREKKGHSCVCISKSGEIGYYDNAWAINVWSKAKDNPYYEKFSHNMGGVVEQLQCFKNHNMFVDTLPTQELVDFYYKKHKENSSAG